MLSDVASVVILYESCGCDDGWKSWKFFYTDSGEK